MKKLRVLMPAVGLILAVSLIPLASSEAREAQQLSGEPQEEEKVKQPDEMTERVLHWALQKVKELEEKVKQLESQAGGPHTGADPCQPGFSFRDANGHVR